MAGLVCAAGCAVQAGPLNVVNVNAPKINYLFSPSGRVAVIDTVSRFSTNLPPITVTNGSTATVTNGMLSGFLQSRTYEGQPGTAQAGNYAYVYRLALSRVTGPGTVSLNSMTVNFSPYVSFDYGNGRNYQVFVVTSGGLGSDGVASATVSGSQVTFNFSHPLTISGTRAQTTCYFGMISSTPPVAAANAWASFVGSETWQNTTSPFNWLLLPVRAP